MRKPVIAANWKMNMLPSESESFTADFIPLVKDNENVEIILCPSACSADRVANNLKNSNVKLGIQNVYTETAGAFTGENSVLMAKDLGCEYIILGHSERRSIFGESSALINKKIRTVLDNGLKVILCIGETLEERESGIMEKVLKEQITESLADISTADMEDIVIAYEPVWAIGTGKTATPDQAQDAHAFVRATVKDLLGNATAEAVRIQYGGSVKADNVKELMGQPDIDGALVGGASLKADSFAAIVNF